MEAFFKRFTNKSAGMDFTEVNFELATSPESRKMDEQTFRQLLELITHEVNQPSQSEEIYQAPILSIFEGKHTSPIMST